ncbi:MAG: stage II sporulation protein R [Bacillota bacterium]
MKRTKLVIGVSIVMIMLTIFANKFVFVEQHSTIENNQLLRLHVIANSSSTTDQLLKRKVRDEIIVAGNEIFKDLTDVNQAKQKVRENLDYLANVVEREIRAAGYDYNVDLKVGKFNFPTRSYQDLTLASGEYDALRVEIGEGKGANWWCVLFPPLCFVDSVDKMPPQMINKRTEKETEQVQVEFKIKFVEYLKENPELVESKLNLAKLFEFQEEK